MKIVSQGHFVQRNLISAGSGESYLIGRVHRDVQGTSKTCYYVWKPNSHSLWRGVSASSFFDPHWTQECDCNRDTLYPTEQSLRVFRVRSVRLFASSWLTYAQRTKLQERYPHRFSKQTFPPMKNFLKTLGSLRGANRTFEREAQPRR
jgi:hypothetical protein